MLDWPLRKDMCCIADILHGSYSHSIVFLWFCPSHKTLIVSPVYLYIRLSQVRIQVFNMVFGYHFVTFLLPICSCSYMEMNLSAAVHRYYQWQGIFRKFHPPMLYFTVQQNATKVTEK